MSSTPGFVTQTELRALFAARLSDLYGTEVPAYQTLVEASRGVNESVLHRRGIDAERLGTIDRVTAERHGAIRVGSPRELAEVARVFAALGMHPCGFYDLREARPTPIPVVSTAFRPVESAELAANPFRVFTSLLVPEDRRFFDRDLERRIGTCLGGRLLFPEELLTLAERAVRGGGLDEADAATFLTLASGSFALSAEPVDRTWYQELERISSVAADIAGVTTTHINHLTPRVLDIEALYRDMQQRGIEMIDRIQGPPGWDGPDVLLRQTSFRALAEPRAFRESDGRITRGDLRVRFGEVEQRGIALTPRGRDLYDRMMQTIDRRATESPREARESVAVAVWEEEFPRTEEDLCVLGLGHFTFRLDDHAVRRLTEQPGATLADADLERLVRGGVLVPEPIVYEDFLPRSAAGIFASNLSGAGQVDHEQGGAPRSPEWMSDVVGADVRVPDELYHRLARASLDAAQEALTLSGLVAPEMVLPGAVAPTS